MKTQMQLAQEAIARLKSMNRQELTSELVDAGIADTTNSINANSDTFKKALLRTQTKHADIIKALEDK
ncbi:hypothetical protein KKJ09_20035 [Xenorhabdus bovienii]|uniref:hypothetical protein n=1 Tax=Xenorhabdus bovienii TaxID=40576 RepID=UPI0023B3361C|nr:hypothetical protein [Xenorhabdus bovienii]MDE9495807.1 hypothetical protein [Xenorhabdus bovienii]MDE9504384.1 hypothetical protein [Xenorhabdus bovienii]